LVLPVEEVGQRCGGARPCYRRRGVEAHRPGPTARSRDALAQWRTARRLTPRQREILELIAQGYNNAAIAERLVLAEKSIENQINLLYQQLDIDRSLAAIQPRVKAVLIYLEESRHQSGPRLTF